MRRRAFGGALSALLLLSLDAGAQEATGYAVNRYEPSERGSDWFAAESLDLRGNGRPAIGVVGDYSYRSLAIYEADGSVRAAPVKNNLFAHLGASLVLFDRLRLGASLPLQLFTDGNGGLRGTTYYPAPPHEQGIGDLRLSADVRLLGEYGDAFTAAIGMSVWAPTGDRAQYTSDGDVRLMPRAMVAGDIGLFTYAAKVGFTYHARQEQFAGSPIGNEIPFVAAAGLRLADKKLTVGPEVFGTTYTDDVFKTRSTPLEGLLGAHYLIGDSVRIGGGVGMGLTRGYGAPQMRGLLMIEWQPPAEVDSDGDGILDGRDACPHERGVASDDPAKNGCPEVIVAPPADTDHDGIDDAHDACVDVPGVKTSDPKTNGCPPDRDGDGIVDTLDACPDAKGAPTGDPRTNGCPDTDGDGVFDQEDACVDVAGIKTSDPKTNGCPDPDRDKDGIANEADACPDQPGKPDPDPKKNGCPKAFVEGGLIRIMDQVKFKTGSAEILPGKDSEEVLLAVKKVLSDHPEIAKVRVEGHTDNRGAAALNKKLSADRAQSVVKWLVKAGIPAERLSSAGFGSERPIDENSTEQGRKNNRRVEFHIEGNDAGGAGAKQ